MAANKTHLGKVTCTTAVNPITLSWLLSVAMDAQHMQFQMVDLCS